MCCTRSRCTSRDDGEDGELGPPQAAGRQHLVVELGYRPGCLAQIETRAGPNRFNVHGALSLGRLGHNRCIYTYISAVNTFFQRL